MSTGEMTQRIAEVSPHFKARIAGVFYLLTFLIGFQELADSTTNAESVR